MWPSLCGIISTSRSAEVISNFRSFQPETSTRRSQEKKCVTSTTPQVLEFLVFDCQKIDFLIYSTASPPCRSVQMVAKTLGVKLNLILVDVYSKDHPTPEFVKINPQHTIPTLVDNGFAIWESRAILAYLAEKYGKNDSLYPKDPQKRATINQRLYFDMGTLYPRAIAYFIPIIRQGAKPDPELYKKIEEALELLDGFLANTKYVAGEEPTIADYALIATYSTIVLGGTDLSRFKNVCRWYESRSSLTGIEINEASLELIKGTFKKT